MKKRKNDLAKETQSERFSTLSSFANLIRWTLRDYGVDVVPLFQKAGIELVKLTDPDARFSVKQMQTLWRLAVETTGDPCFGLKAGQQIQPTALHGLGFAWLASDSLRLALKRLAKYSSLLSTFANISMEEDDQKTHLIFSAGDPKTQLAPETSDFYLVAIFRMCELTSGKPLIVKHVYINRPLPVEVLRRQLDAICRCPITYGSSDIVLEFDNHTLDVPLTTPNPKLARIHDNIVEDYLAQYLSNSITHQVSEIIINHLPSGAPNAEDIAGQLGISRRTLHRKLEQEGVNFRELVNSTRQKMAKSYLESRSRPLSEIAYLLGFSSPANFTRAFKRWHGISPAKFANRF